MNNIQNVLESVLLVTGEPTSTESQTKNSMEDKHPCKEINSIKRNRVGQILDGNLVSTPCKHSHNR